MSIYLFLIFIILSSYPVSIDTTKLHIVIICTFSLRLKCITNGNLVSIVFFNRQFHENIAYGKYKYKSYSKRLKNKKNF